VEDEVVPNEEEVAIRPLDRGQLSVLRIRAALFAAIVLAIAIAGDLLPMRSTPVPLGVLSVSLGLLVLFGAIWSPPRRYYSWSYGVGGDELHLRHGLWTRVRTIVPFARVQHIDVAQGPIERKFGVGRLILHTAGTRNSAVELPGLAIDEAGRIRDLIRSQIRQDLV
jgi:membrane protein YdbS with pleckstrin-like domain